MTHRPRTQAEKKGIYQKQNFKAINHEPIAIRIAPATLTVCNTERDRIEKQGHKINQQERKQQSKIIILWQSSGIAENLPSGVEFAPAIAPTGRRQVKEERSGGGDASEERTRERSLELAVESEEEKKKTREATEGE